MLLKDKFSWYLSVISNAYQFGKSKPALVLCSLKHLTLPLVNDQEIRLPNKMSYSETKNNQ